MGAFEDPYYWAGGRKEIKKTQLSCKVWEKSGGEGAGLTRFLASIRV